ncbi:MAG: tetratricopeptide repeat protein [Candidatus Helarchaeota archaeon]|nr:tetratricopeptide repeat protein [Candidatus Helarchaeota archaeon]
MVEEEKEELGDAIKAFNQGLESHIEGRLDKALKHFEKALPTFQEFGVEDMIAGTLHEIGMIYQDRGELDTALEYFNRSSELSEKIRYMPGCAKTYFQIGTLYEEKGDIITAKDFYKKAERYRTRKPPGLSFIMVTFFLLGLLGTGAGLLGVAANAGFEPFFIPPALWAQMSQNLTSSGPVFLVFGFFALLAGIGILRLKGWGWVLGIFTSLQMVIAIIFSTYLAGISIFGIIFFCYLSKESIQEMYDVK